MKIFGMDSGPQQLSVFGSLAAGLPAYSSDVEVIQGISQFTSGWFAAVLGNNSPAIEDMNSLHYVFGYQLAYLMQQGVAEWDDATTYYAGSLASGANGEIYISLTDDNLNNALTSTTNWALFRARVRTLTTTGNIGQTDGVIRMSGTVGYTATLPAVASTPIGKCFTIKNVSSNGSVMTLAGNGAETIDGSNTLTLQSTPVFESITVQNNGTSWDIV